jgi:hypothetical protein
VLVETLRHRECAPCEQVLLFLEKELCTIVLWFEIHPVSFLSFSIPSFRIFLLFIFTILTLAMPSFVADIPRSPGARSDAARVRITNQLGSLPLGY